MSMLTNIIHQLVGGKVVEDIVCRCVLSNSVSLGLSKHLFLPIVDLLLPIVGKERGGDGEAGEGVAVGIREGGGVT